MRLRSWATGASGAWLVAACSLVVSFDDLTFGQAQGGAAGSLGGEGGTGGGEGGAVPDPVCIADASKVLHVDGASGEDTAEGGPDGPLLSIAAAIERARMSRGAITEIHVCEGSYEVPELVIDFAVSLCGGFSCIGWARVPSYGYPELMSNTSIARDANAVAGDATLELSGAAVDANVVIDGLVVRGHAAGDSRAVQIQNGATPRLSNNDIVGGSGPNGTEVGSVGVWIGSSTSDPDVAPTLYLNRIDGGTGSATTGSRASVGVMVVSGNPVLTENLIMGGGGTNSAASAGSAAVIAQGAGTTTVRDNDIRGGTGSCAGDCTGSVGAVITTGEAELSGNRIDAGAPTAGQCYAVLVNAATANIERNRIHGGTPPTSWRSKGIVATNCAGLAISNNMIHGGVSDVGARGVYLQDCAGAIVVHNTVFGGVAPAGEGAIAIDIDASTALGGTVVENILFATSPFDNAGIRVCGVDLDSVRSNVVLGDAISVKTCAADYQLFSDAVVVGVPGVASDNLNIRSDCTPSLTCIDNDSCVGSLACAQQLFKDFVASDHGTAALWSAGWVLDGDMPCGVAKSGLDLNRIVVDHFGTERTPFTSMGAHESELCGEE